MNDTQRRRVNITSDSVPWRSIVCVNNARWSDLWGSIAVVNNVRWSDLVTHCEYKVYIGGVLRSLLSEKIRLSTTAVKSRRV
jgi:hypothetical protein